MVRANVVLTDYEAKLSRALPDYVRVLSELEIEPPFFLYLTLVNVYGWYLRGEEFRTSEFAFETQIVKAPEVAVSEAGFDTLWCPSSVVQCDLASGGRQEESA